MLWAVTINGRPQPFDPEPDADGEFVLVKRREDAAGAGAPLALSISKLGLFADGVLAADAATYVPHHASCPSWERR